MIDDSAHWTPLRRELLKWFRVNAAPLVEAYEGAIRLVDDGDFPGRIHFIAHAVRDISDRLVYVLDPQLNGNRVQYANCMDRIEKDWPQLTSVGDASPAVAEIETLRIDHKVASMIDSLVKAHRESRQRPSNHELLFRFLMRKEPLQLKVHQRLIADFKKTRNWFMGRAHLRYDEVLQVDESELQTQFKNFEGMLHSVVSNFFIGKNELDEILRQANG